MNHYAEPEAPADDREATSADLRTRRYVDDADEPIRMRRILRGRRLRRRTPTTPTIASGAAESPGRQFATVAGADRSGRLRPPGARCGTGALPRGGAAPASRKSRLTTRATTAPLRRAGGYEPPPRSRGACPSPATGRRSRCPTRMRTSRAMAMTPPLGTEPPRRQAAATAGPKKPAARGPRRAEQQRNRRRPAGSGRRRPAAAATAAATGTAPAAQRPRQDLHAARRHRRLRAGARRHRRLCADARGRRRHRRHRRAPRSERCGDGGAAGGRRPCPSTRPSCCSTGATRPSSRPRRTIRSASTPTAGRCASRRRPASPGVKALIGPGLATRLAGHDVRVTIVARSSREAGAAGLRFAYQSGVAISHWQTANLGAGLSGGRR